MENEYDVVCEDGVSFPLDDAEVAAGLSFVSRSCLSGSAFLHVTPLFFPPAVPAVPAVPALPYAVVWLVTFFTSWSVRVQSLA